MEVDGSDATCDPASQHIRFGKRIFNETGAILLDTLVERDLSRTDRRYTPGMDLEPVEHYFYEVTWYGEDGSALGSRVIGFNTGPICSRSELLPPVILSLPDEAVAEGGARLSWEFQGCTPESIELVISSSPIFAPADTDTIAYDRAYNAVSVVETCRYFYWQIASTMIVPPTEILFLPDVYFPFSGRSEPMEYEFSGYIRSEYTAPRSFYITGEDCLVPPPDFGIPPILLEEGIPSVILLEPANCRSGPTMDFPLLSILPAGNQYEIRARNTPGDAWMIFDPSFNNTCWVAGDLVEVLGDTSLMQIIDPLPPSLVLPTDTPAVDCSQYTSPLDCGNNPACYWDPNDPPQSNGSCKNK